MKKYSNWLNAPVWALSLSGLAALTATTAMAEQVTLTSNRSGIVFTGELLDFEGSTYTIDTVLGPLKVDALTVTCAGPGCPTISDELVEVVVGSDQNYGSQLSSLIGQSLARNLGGEATEDGEATTVINAAGEPIATLTPRSDVGRGVADLLSGEVDIFLSRQEITPDTLSSFGLGSQIVALDAAVVTVGNSSSVRAISEEALAQIFGGQITNWSDLGYPAAPINVYVPNDGSGTVDFFVERILAPRGLRLLSDTNAVDDIDAALADDPTGIAVQSYSTTGDSRVIVFRGSCGLQVAPTPFTVKTEEYPLTQRIFAYFRNDNESPVLDSIVDLLGSDGTQRLIDDSDLIALSTSMQTTDQQGLRFQSAVIGDDNEVSIGALRAMFVELLNAERLSINFRFRTGSAELDQRALDDITRVTDLIASGAFDGKEVLVMGFTDSVGAAANNAALAARRADEVLATLVDAAPDGSLEAVTLRSVGIGEVAPVSCNDTDFGTEKNRRVEIWTRDPIGNVN